MLIHEPQTRRALERIAACLTSQRLWHEDLVQEALIHLWQAECLHPGHCVCWYLRSCRFHLQNLLRHGRSIDSPKRRNGHALPIDGEMGPGDLADSMPDAAARTCVREIVMARDLLSALLPSLDPLETQILDCLLDGRGMRETARRLKISHTCVATKRRWIGVCLLELMAEARPLPKGRSAIRARIEKTVANRASELLPINGGLKCHREETTCPTGRI